MNPLAKIHTAHRVLTDLIHDDYSSVQFTTEILTARFLGTPDQPATHCPHCGHTWTDCSAVLSEGRVG